MPTPPARHQAVDLSVVIPVYNEEPNLLPLWDALRPVLEQTGETYEVFFVDDGSADGSGPALDRLARSESGSNPGGLARLRVLHLDRNSGQSAAFQAGFTASRGRWIVTLDADLQNDPGDIPNLLSHRHGAEMICGVRVDRHDNWIRRVSSRIGNGVRNWITQDRIVDTGCSLKVFRGDLVRRIPLFRGLHRFLPTLMKMEGARVVEVPVHHHERHAGESKYGIGNRMWTGLADCLAVRWMKMRRVRYEVEESAAAGEATEESPPKVRDEELSGVPGEENR